MFCHRKGCERYNKDQGEGSKFCCECGQKLKQERLIVCIKCQSIFDCKDDPNFCGNCGEKMEVIKLDQNDDINGTENNEKEDQQSEIDALKQTHKQKSDIHDVMPGKPEPTEAGEKTTQSNGQNAFNALQTPKAETMLLKPNIKGKKVFNIMDQEVIVDERYEVTNLIGCGAYGFVYSAFDKQTNQEVAIKKIHMAFDGVIDAKRILREIKILKFFDHENIVKLVDIQRPDHQTDYTEVYIITEKMEADLNRLIQSKQALSNQHYCYLMYQLLRGVYFLHTSHIMHRDIKPSNLLVNVNCDLKLCDFGLARGLNVPCDADLMTKYVVTRWYRAPEVVLYAANYDESIDLWAVGCVFAELIGRKPVFDGRHHLDQVVMIQKFIGKIPEEDLMCFQDANARQYLLKNERELKLDKSYNTQEKWQEKFPHVSPDAIDLLTKLLAFNPKKRITVEQAIQHQYFAKILALEPRPPKAEIQFMEADD